MAKGGIRGEILIFRQKNKQQILKTYCLCCIKATKKIFCAFCNKVLNSCATSRRRRVYHQGVSLVYHQHEVLYIIKPQVRCTLKRDEIQPHRGWWYAKPAAWIKKFDKSKLVKFFGWACEVLIEPKIIRHPPRQRASRSRVLFALKAFYRGAVTCNLRPS